MLFFLRSILKLLVISFIFHKYAPVVFETVTRLIGIFQVKGESFPMILSLSGTDAGLLLLLLKLRPLVLDDDAANAVNLF